VSNESGTLFVVATPIGNLGDLSPRAVHTLREVALVAAEDTRHTRRLFDHFGIGTPMVSVHEHNEGARVAQLLARLERGESVALVSDAGTPLISDPGYRLVRAARKAGVRISPLPGPSALIAALSVSGLPTDRFAFEGFLPAKAGQRLGRLQSLAAEPRTLVFYETGRRIEACVHDMVQTFGATRQAVVARELTKLHEEIHGDELGRLVSWLGEVADRRRGEIVLVVAGAPEAGGDANEERVREMLRVLLKALPTRRAVQAVCELTGESRNRVYRLALELE